MKLSLKKARKLEQEIKNKVSSLKNFPYLPSVTAPTNLTAEQIQNKKQEAMTKLEETLTLCSKLTNLRFELRARIAVENANPSTEANQGINSLMNRRECLKEELEILKDIQGSMGTHYTPQTIEDVEELLALAKANAEAKNSSYQTSYWNFVTKEYVEKLQDQVLDLTRALEHTEETLTRLNLTATVTLSDEEAKLLKSVKLLA